MPALTVFSGSRLRELRLQKKLGQDDLAHRLRAAGHGTTQTTISRWENGVSVPHSAVLPALAAELGVQVGDLYGEAEDDEEAALVAVLTEMLRRIVAIEVNRSKGAA